MGVTWYGAVKYCNWLTVTSGKGDDQRCYSEGLNQTNWHPAHLTYATWIDDFSDLERLAWVSNYEGYRLPMDDYSGTANYYNEFYKMAAWSGITNTRYAFGRDSIDQQDANYSSSGDPFEAFVLKTTPVGYYDGSDHGGSFQTRSNANHWGLMDLSGNVAEWTTETQGPGSTTYREHRGGGWSSGSGGLDTYSRGDLQPFGAWSTLGFRAVTTSP